MTTTWVRVRDGRAARRFLRVTAAAAAGVLAAGCGSSGGGPAASNSPTSSTASNSPTSPAATGTPTAPGSSSSLPAGPTSPAASSSAPVPSTSPAVVPTTPAGTVRSSVYLLVNGKIAAAHRAVEGPGVARGSVLALLAGPTPAEQGVGFSSAVPAGTTLLGLTIDAGTASVDVSKEFGTGVSAVQTAQLVYTLTQFPDVQQVRLLVGGQLVAAMLTRLDYEDLTPAVLVESPTVGDTVHSPVRVYGSANTFEAVFQLEVTDWDGRIVAQVTVHATSGTGTRGTFDVTIPYSVDRAGAGEVIASMLSPKDGSRIVISETLLTVAP